MFNYLIYYLRKLSIDFIILLAERILYLSKEYVENASNMKMNLSKTRLSEYFILKEDVRAVRSRDREVVVPLLPVERLDHRAVHPLQWHIQL